MKIKVKLKTLAVGLYFCWSLHLGLIGGFQIISLSRDTNNILVANYNNTLDFSRNMLKALMNWNRKTIPSDHFRDNLNKQQNNITEVGEQEYTDRLTKHFLILKQTHLIH